MNVRGTLSTRKSPVIKPVDLVREANKAKREALELLLLSQMRALKIPEPDREVRFHTVRQWRFDFAYIDSKIAIEVEGGQWSGGRHTRGAGYEEDTIKYNEATLLGWKVYRFTGDMIKRGDAVNFIERMLNE